MQRLKKIIDKVLKGEKKKGKINLAVVSDRKIRKLNRQFRGKDQATDVLSFFMGEDGIIGDIAVSSQVARKNARRYGMTFNQEMKRLVIHGALHLLGYNHGRKMRNAEKIYEEL